MLLAWVEEEEEEEEEACYRTAGRHLLLALSPFLFHPVHRRRNHHHGLLGCGVSVALESPVHSLALHRALMVSMRGEGLEAGTMWGSG